MYRRFERKIKKIINGEFNTLNFYSLDNLEIGVFKAIECECINIKNIEEFNKKEYFILLDYKKQILNELKKGSELWGIVENNEIISYILIANNINIYTSELKLELITNKERYYAYAANTIEKKRGNGFYTYLLKVISSKYKNGLYIAVDKENKASKKVIERNGFKCFFSIELRNRFYIKRYRVVI